MTWLEQFMHELISPADAAEWVRIWGLLAVLVALLLFL